MSSFPNPETPFKVKKDVVISFFMSNGYIGKIFMGDYITLAYKDETSEAVTIPNYPYLTVDQIKVSMQKVNIPFTEFEEYLEHLITIREGEFIIESCIDSPPLK